MSKPDPRISELSDLVIALSETSIGAQFSRRRFQLSPTPYSEGPRTKNVRIRPDAGRSEADAAFWLNEVTKASYAAGYGTDDPDERKAIMWAVRILGLPGWQDSFRAMSDVRVYGAETTAMAWARYMRPMDTRYVGYVYCATDESAPGFVKIGFSTDPERRVKALGYQRKSKLRLLTSRPGTIIHEWALHRNIPHAVEPEWYPREVVPAWLLGEVNTAHKNSEG